MLICLCNSSDFSTNNLTAFLNCPPSGSPEVSFSLQKREITREQRKECVSIVERIFEDGLSIEGDVIVINFFALVLENCSYLEESYC